eukprot:m.459389 g.459389  ORF g.459389 m.459389 type:complete len:93 (+) comp20341_c2_seq1:2105-2383(+)
MSMVAGLLGFVDGPRRIKEHDEQRSEKHKSEVVAAEEAGEDPSCVWGIDELVIKTWLSRGVVGVGIGGGLFIILHRRQKCSCLLPPRGHGGS